MLYVNPSSFDRQKSKIHCIFMKTNLQSHQMLRYKLFHYKSQNKMLPFYYPYTFYPQYIQPIQYSYVPSIPMQEIQSNERYATYVKKEQGNIQSISSQNQSETPKKIELKPSELKEQGYQVTKRLWSEEEDKLLLHSVQIQNLNWKQISKLLNNRNPKMCYNRYKRLCKKKKIKWTRQQDEKLKYLVQERKLKWKHIEKHFQNRRAKQLRQRYLNFLRPNLSRQPWTVEQDLKLIQCVNQMGKKWKNIEKVLTKRSQNQIKNRYYGRIQHILKKRQNITTKQQQK